LLRPLLGTRTENNDSHARTRLLASRQRHAVQDPTFALGKDTLDQRQIMADPGAPALDCRPSGAGQPFGGLLQRGPGGPGSGDQIAIELALPIFP
jgi:hypothetical protein